MEAHGAIVDTHHNVVGTHAALWRRIATTWSRLGNHDANCGHVWTSRRDIVGAHVFCVGVCGRVYCAHVDAHV